DKRVYYGDEKIRAEITAQSDKKAIPASFTIIISKKTNSSFRYSDVFKIVAEKSISADKLGKALFYYKPEQSGYYKIKAFSRDKNGNIVFNDYQFLYISKDHKLDNNEKHFYIISDKQTYTPGETATAYIILPVRNKKVFVTLEADKLHAMEVINIKGNVGVFRFPVKENYTPNVYVNVGFFNNGYFNGMFNIIRVPDTRHKLQLSVTPDRNEYKPAETALYNIKTCDSDGKPVSAQVTLGVADKSVFLLAEDFFEESVHHFFYYIRPNTVCTFPFTFNEQREYFPPLALPSGTRFAAYTTFNGLKPGFIDPSTAQMLTKPVKIKIPREDIRSYFPDTCYFNPNIITDQNGNARVKVKLPDSLTTWRADAKGITMDTKVGESESEVKVAKKLMVRLITPRFIRQRDKLMISGIVHNYLKTAKTVKMELESSGVKMISENGIEINVPPGQNRKVEWKIEAPFAGEAEFTLRGMTDEESDGMKLNVPILPHGTEHRKNLSGFTEQKSELEFFVPKNSIPGTVKLRINISPSLGASIIPALKYLSEYPYGCTEQTLSRFLPAITALKCLKDSGILSKDIKKSIQEVTGKSLQRLAKLQHSDGGWGWWENDSSDAEFTSMVVYGLYQASESGYSIRDCDIGSGIGWLYLNYKKETDLNTRVAMLHALTFTGRGQKKWADNLFRARKKLNTSAQAKLAQTLYKMGKKAEADVMLKLLEKEAVASKTHAYWSECNQGWIENPNYVTATVLRTFIMIKPQHPICARAVRYLTSVKDNGHWETTNDTNAALTALVEYMQATKELNGDFTGSLKINGREVRAFSMKATGDGSSGIDLELSVKDLKPGKNIISFEKNGNGRLYYCLNLTWFDTEEKVKASTNRFFRETRKYYLLDYRKSADGKLRAKLLKAPYVRIKTGDTIIVQTFCKSSREMKYAITEDPKPSGFETAELPKNLVLPGVDSDNYNNRNYHYYYDNFNYLNFYYDYKTEDRDDKMVDFRWFLGEGKNISIYALKPETGGVFHTMPATLSLMYFPEFRASSDEMIFEVTEGKNDKSIIVPDKTGEKAEGESSFTRIAGKLAK
ncbi:MAG: hypothetical protein LWY06_06475, partial [Firmicutes bacterium]|nr:hypothetical protein [Bacillota bacterium]